jgi:hypothetical protein
MLVLVSLICLFIIPGRALAQDPTDDPCCHRAPSSISAFNGSVIQGDIQVLKSAISDMSVNARLNATTTPVPDRLSLRMLATPVVKEESWTPGYRRQS